IMQFKNKVVFITGGGRGIGRALGLAFAQEGGKVVLTARTQAQIEAVATEIKAAGQEALAIPMDVTRMNQVKEAVDGAVKAFGTVDVLINNAGVIDASMITRMNEEQWDKVLD